MNSTNSVFRSGHPENIGRAESQPSDPRCWWNHKWVRPCDADLAAGLREAIENRLQQQEVDLPHQYWIQSSRYPFYLTPAEDAVPCFVSAADSEYGYFYLQSNSDGHEPWAHCIWDDYRELRDRGIQQPMYIESGVKGEPCVKVDPIAELPETVLDCVLRGVGLDVDEGVCFPNIIKREGKQATSLQPEVIYGRYRLPNLAYTARYKVDSESKICQQILPRHLRVYMNSSESGRLYDFPKEIVNYFNQEDLKYTGDGWGVFIANTYTSLYAMIVPEPKE